MISERLNSHCFCVSLDAAALRNALVEELGSKELVTLVEERCPYLFSARPVFISDSQAGEMAEVVAAVEALSALPKYREYVLANAPAIARHNPGGARGVFFGYDFHLGDSSIGVIEINTNAGGAMLNAVMARAHHACCLDDHRMALAAAEAEAFEQHIVQMFLAEWRLSGHSRPLKTIAIVDTAPQEQYLYPEFLLFKNLFERNGLHVIIADPSELELFAGVLMHGDTPIDLVYNRLTDFYLEAPGSSALREAYLENAVVLTPHPQAHALYADKGNMALLGDDELLTKFGTSQEVRDVLAKHILHTEIVDAVHADRIWSERRNLFFKPKTGYGSRAAYRGDKVTKRVWQDILAGQYIAQAIMPPGERLAGTPDGPETLKFDLRCYAYGGKIQWTAARLYQGQTTNFRTPGGGFSPVYTLPDVRLSSEINGILKAASEATSCCDKSCT